MSEMEVPKGWELKKIIDIGEIVTGSTPKTSNSEYYGDDYPFYSPSDLISLQISKSNKRLSKKGLSISRYIPENSILVQCIGDLGKCSIIKQGGATNQQINSIIPKLNLVLPKFVYYWIQSSFFRELMWKNASKTTLPILNKSKFASLPFFLTTLEIQRKIVQKLDYLLGKLEEKKNTINIDLEKNILLLEKIIGIKKERSRQSTIENYVTDTLINSIVLKCNSTRKDFYFDYLVNCCLDIIDTPHSTVPYFNSGFPVIRTTNIEPYKINFSNCKFTSKEVYLQRKKQLEAKIGDVLYTREAPWGIAAKVEQENFVVGQRILLLRPNSMKINSDFLNLILNSSFVYNQAKSVVNETTSGHINIKDIKKFKIPIIPETEQNKTLKKINQNLPMYDSIKEKLKDSIVNQRKVLDYLKNINSSILNLAFTGKLVN